MVIQKAAAFQYYLAVKVGVKRGKKKNLDPLFDTIQEKESM